MERESLNATSQADGAAGSGGEEQDDALRAMGQGARWCYFVPSEPHDANGFVPSLVVEGVAGHRPMLGNGEGSSPWYWGKTFDEARETCEHVNRKRGITPEMAVAIVASSMRESTTARRAFPSFSSVEA